MATKTFKGTILSLIPKKGFGFISPVWGNGNSNRNIFFVFAETKNGKCYIPALASAENRHEVVSKKGTKIVVPNEPQVLYFNLELGKNDQFVAVNLRDSEHVTPEEAWQHYQETGEYLGKFDSVEEADAYAEQLHNEVLQ